VLQVRNLVPVFAEHHRNHYPKGAVTASDCISMKKSEAPPSSKNSKAHMAFSFEMSLVPFLSLCRNCA
jgi:hypothetical protein